MAANLEIDNLNFPQVKILVVGDLMLDQYWQGDTNRVSPEAPVPVVRVNDQELRIGGAANVVLNVQTLGCKATLMGVVGADEIAQQLTGLIDNYGIEHALTVDPEYATICKLRILSRQQQMLRLDHEDESPSITASALQTMHDKFATIVKDFDIVILSDYAKGVLSNPRPFIETAREHNVPVYVDPKTTNLGIYKGATVLKPNLREFEDVVGKCDSLEDLEGKAEELLKSCGIQQIVITRGGEGSSVVSLDQPAIHLPACSGEVFDVTGAGDTVIATIAACVGCDIDLASAVRVSMHAAAVVVGKVGTSTVNVKEIKSSMQRKISLPLGIIKEEVLRDVMKISQSRGEKVVFVNGCYDMLHYGHTRFFAAARELGDRLVVGVNTDASIKRLKGDDRPFHSLECRMEVLASLKAVDWVVPFDEDTPGRIVESLSPDVLVKGGENFKTIDDIPESEGVKHVQSYGGEVHLIARTEGVSSTEMLEFTS